MNDKRVYLAGRIEGLTWEEANGWRGEAIKTLESFQIECYNPCDHVNAHFRKNKVPITVEAVDELGGLTGYEIYTQDMFYLTKWCNIFLAKIGDAQVGTFVEWGMATVLGHILIGFDMGRRKKHPFIHKPAHVLYDSLDEALDFIVNI